MVGVGQTAEMRTTLERMKEMIAELKERPAGTAEAVSLTDLRSELRSLVLSLEAG